MGNQPNAYQLLGRSWVALLLIFIMSLAACQPVMPAGTSSTPSDATVEPSAEATVEATEEATVAPTEEATAEATAEATEEATVEAGSEGDEIGLMVSQILAQQLQISPDQVEVISVEAVEWPDACLGVYTADMMCAQVITPGYRVTVAVDGQEYEYHTNSDGSFVQLASAPEVNIGSPLITWQQTLDTCQAAQFGRDVVAFGPCMGVMMGGKLATPERQAEFADLIATYAPFEAETPAGTITFNGEGSALTRPAEQRMIAEWSRLAAQEASTGHSDESSGAAIVWHREGGIAGFCDDLIAYITGQLHTSTCRGEEPENVQQRLMTPEELDQIYAWVDEYAPFEYHHDDGAAADSMVISLVFSGTGSTVADEAVQQEILSFTEDLYAEASN